VGGCVWVGACGALGVSGACGGCVVPSAGAQPAEGRALGGPQPGNKCSAKGIATPLPPIPDGPPPGTWPTCWPLRCARPAPAPSSAPAPAPPAWPCPRRP
jgi:hypothetical protein